MSTLKSKTKKTSFGASKHNSFLANEYGLEGFKSNKHGKDLLPEYHKRRRLFQNNLSFTVFSGA